MKFLKINSLSLTLFLSLCLVLSSCKKDEEDREQFLGTYSVVEECSTDTYSYTFSVTEGNGSNEIILANFGDFQQQVRAEVDGRFLSIPNQSINNKNGLTTIQKNIDAYKKYSDRTTLYEASQKGVEMLENTSLKGAKKFDHIYGWRR